MATTATLSNFNLPSPFLSLKIWRRMLQGRAPGQVVIQFTDQCNATCAQCGMRRDNDFRRSTLDVANVKRLLDSMVSRGVVSVSFTGGEPFLYATEIVECSRHARSIGIRYIRTGTNGFQFRNHSRADFPDRVLRLAENIRESGLNTFWISIDSASAAIHEQNRGLPDSIEGIRKALPIFHGAGVYPSANLGINRLLGGDVEPSPATCSAALYTHYQDAFRRFYSHIHDLGFTIVNACYPMDMDDESESSVFTATSKDRFIRFSRTEKIQLFRAMFDVIPEFRDKLRIFTPRSALRSLIRHYEQGIDDSYACRGGIDYFFVDAREMNTYPCGYRGEENLGKFWELDMEKLGREPWCRQCDWECFRDPSELLGPILDFRQRPALITKKFLDDAVYRRLWLDDLLYYRACSYFNALVPPRTHKLSRFGAAA